MTGKVPVGSFRVSPKAGLPRRSFYIAAVGLCLVGSSLVGLGSWMATCLGNPGRYGQHGLVTLVVAPVGVIFFLAGSPFIVDAVLVLWIMRKRVARRAVGIVWASHAMPILLTAIAAALIAVKYGINLSFGVMSFGALMPICLMFAVKPLVRFIKQAAPPEGLAVAPSLANGCFPEGNGQASENFDASFGRSWDV